VVKVRPEERIKRRNKTKYTSIPTGRDGDHKIFFCL
jgi:hypothetical protein